MASGQPKQSRDDNKQKNRESLKGLQKDNIKDRSTNKVIKTDDNNKATNKINQDRTKRSPRKKNIKSKTNLHEQPPEPKIKDDLIRNTGLLDAYETLLRSVCKHGLPSGNIYEYAAQEMERYEKRKKAKQLKLKAEIQIRKAAQKKKIQQQG